MAADENLELALQILQEDLEELETRQKGKQRAGQPTDLELAITTMREDILALQTCIQDRAMAVSTSAAIVSDQHLLQSLRQEEAVAERDHGYANALQNDQPHTLMISNANSAHEGDFDDSISTVMEDLIDKLALTNKPDNGEGSSRLVSPSHARIPCVSCLEFFDRAELFMNPCGECLCHDCTRELFLGSIRDEELYPPRCCGRIITPETALLVLDYRELYQFSQRAIEYSAKDRVYCAEPTCSKFIPPGAIVADYGTCLGCHRRTHLPCRSLEHPSVDCPMDQSLQDVLALAETEDWRRCSNCRAMVELKHGCNHITCAVTISATFVVKNGKHASAHNGKKEGCMTLPTRRLPTRWRRMQTLWFVKMRSIG
ncbi:uncharacterized protein KD926_011038 [Aspergillus affinis]|uniref:uncharacterized protein n=1 Tax=Aspergillus affinis TaxID=1070780 RepID=UPI0022FE19AD|nr:uncharacterized protein KD926_011038 [Aspergillus affinis]KAI9044865.1 hypothetical protein KD926_011038 [Aspergillus affinis]